MNRGFVLFLGCALTFGSSWVGLVFAPFSQVKSVGPYEDERTGAVYPKPPTELEAKGRAVYVANGCVYCHSQQVRGPGYGADMARGWGTRRTVPRDHLYDDPLMLGTMRTGPDLANVGKRYSADWHHKHLYNPRMMSPGSVMPTFAFLYAEKPISENKSPNALDLAGPWATGSEVVPTEDAVALVAYLMSLDKSFALPEARE